MHEKHLVLSTEKCAVSRWGIETIANQNPPLLARAFPLPSDWNHVENGDYRLILAEYGLSGRYVIAVHGSTKKTICNRAPIRMAPVHFGQLDIRALSDPPPI